MAAFHVGDLVDIVANSAEQRGMPHKFYHGKTGIIFNVAPRSVGIIVHKRVGSRMMEKRVNIRVEHVRHSKCQDDFKARMKANEDTKREAKAKGERIAKGAEPPKKKASRPHPCPLCEHKEQRARPDCPDSIRAAGIS